MAKGSGSDQPANRGKGRPFRKGQSGNPGGRPKENHEVRDLARQHTVEAIERLVTWMRSKDARASVAAAHAILDRGWGKAPQAMTGEGGEGQPELIIRWANA